MSRSNNWQPMITRAPFCLLALLGAILFASPVAAQVFDSGPSDPALFDIVINVPPDPAIGPNASLGGDIIDITTQLNIFGDGTLGVRFNAGPNLEVNISGGVVDNAFTANDSEVNISGGSVGNDFDAISGSEVNIIGGVIGRGFDAFSGSTVNISGGSVGVEDRRINCCGFDANSGSVVNITGGTVGHYFDANSGSTVNISGGSIGEDFEAHSGSTVNISGGNFGQGFHAHPGGVVNISGGSISARLCAEAGSDLELIGGEFQLNGAAFSGSEISLSGGDIFTGTLADGTAFIFAEDGFDDLSGVQLTQVALPTLDLSPIVVSTANPNLPLGLRAGQTLSLLDGGELGPNFQAVDATLNIEGGSIGERIAATGGSVNISGGTVGLGLNVFDGEVNISGGTVGGFIPYGSEVNISGGRVLNFRSEQGSVVNISGGRVDSFITSFGSVVNISGGSIGFISSTNAGSTINIIGSDFALDGVPLDDSLTPGNPFTINENRMVQLSGLYGDGSAFTFNFDFTDYYPHATVTVTLALPPLLGDANQDGEVTFSDITPFIAILQAGTFLQQADCNQDGVVDFADIPAFIAILQAR